MHMTCILDADDMSCIQVSGVLGILYVTAAMHSV